MCTEEQKKKKKNEGCKNHQAGTWNSMLLSNDLIKEQGLVLRLLC